MITMPGNNNTSVAIYEMVAEKPTKIRIQKSIFVLKPNITASPEEIVQKTIEWVNMIDFEKTRLLKSTAANMTPGNKPLPCFRKTENTDIFTKQHTITIKKSIITAIYKLYYDKTLCNKDAFLSTADITSVIQKHYKNNHVTTIQNKKLAYIRILCDRGYLKRIKKAGQQSLYKFCKVPEWIVIPEYNSKEVQDRRLVEIQTMRDK